jgi:hypothetical protein
MVLGSLPSLALHSSPPSSPHVLGVQVGGQAAHAVAGSGSVIDSLCSCEMPDTTASP